MVMFHRLFVIVAAVAMLLSMLTIKAWFKTRPK
jgi:hypothetical protein